MRVVTGELDPAGAGSPGPRRRPAAGPRSWLRALPALRRHRWFLVILAAGTALRVLTMLGYRPALWFPDSYTYIVTVFRPRPDLVRPAGYSAFLKLLEPFHSFAMVTAVQHLLGLATGVLIYRAARRAPRWAATLATVPVLLDAYQIEVEHLLVSDTLFMFLVVAAVTLSLAGRRSAVTGPAVTGSAVAIGLLLAAATLTRTVGQPLIVVLAGWFVLRGRVGGRVGGRIRFAGVLLAAALVPVLVYGAWFHATYQRVGLVGANGAFLYARTMSFADCAKMDPPPELRVLCDPRPAERRPPSQDYLWAKDSPLVVLPGITFSQETDDLAGRFAALAIRSQPLDYAASVLTELGRTFVWGRPIYPDQEIYDYYEFPSASPPPPGRWAARLGVEMGRRYEAGPIGTEVAEPYAGWMRAYQDVARLPGTALLVILLVPPVVAIVRRRRVAGRPGERAGGWRVAGPPGWLLPWSTAVVLLIVPPAVAEFDYRYVLPAVPLACLAAALCVSRAP
ncbi:hypothetical protein GCM10012289_51860 [Nonomuraea cavernae]|uniref:Phospholipid carrier-dependent glycosyltransferase n=1 Tax=Nonomuraea cavernae TaxID=2045107 RepID=A0A917Z5R1_9ACTN|nr:hypothetical protein GCM10012289_51860 [Nonomuraea cavernae]